MIRSLFLIFFFLGTYSIQSQKSLEGTVKTIEKAPLSGVNVLLYYGKEAFIVGFTQTDKEGIFTIQLPQRKDSLVLGFSAFNYKEKKIELSNFSTTISTVLDREITVLKEIKIKSNTVTVRGDTITFNVEQMASKSDFYIGDVIARLPGIEIENGIIKYQGIPINRYYTHGKNLLGAHYRPANENIRHGLIKNISIYKNHQPIKALEDIEKSEAAAINLDFKQSALGKPNSNGSLATLLGTEKANWKLTGYTIIIDSLIQNFSGVSTNNVGDTQSSSLGIFKMPNSPLLSANSVGGVGSLSTKSYYYLFNESYAVNANNLISMKNDNDFKLNFTYNNDRFSRASSLSTTYFNPNNTQLEVLEKHKNNELKNQIGLQATIEKNLKKDFLHNELTINALWTNIHDAMLATTATYQKLDNKRLEFQYDLRWIHVAKRNKYEINSTIGYSQLPEELNVRPSSLFIVVEKPSTDLTQKVNTRQFFFNSRSGINKWTKIGVFSFTPTVNLFYKSLSSQLYDTSNQIVESLGMNFSNDFKNFSFNSNIDSRYTYKNFNQKLTLTASFNPHYVFNTAADNRLKKHQKISQLFTTNGINLQYSLLYNLQAKISYHNRTTYQMFMPNGFGPIMNNYRSLTVVREGSVSSFKNSFNNYDFSFSYNTSESLWSFAAGMSYGTNASNRMLSQNNNTNTTTNEFVQQNNKSNSKGIFFESNKFISSIRTSIGIKGEYSLSTNNQISNGQLFEIINLNYNYEGSIKSKPLSWLDFSYKYTYVERRPKKGTLSQIGSTKIYNQNASITVSPWQKWHLQYSLNDNYINQNKKRFLFMDAILSYKHNKHYSFYLEGRNLGNINSMVSAEYVSNTLIVSNYEMRPISFLAGVNFVL